MKNNSCCDSTFLVVQLFFLKESLNERLMLFRKGGYPFLALKVKFLIINRKKY